MSVVSLSQARADKAGDNSLWTVAELLRGMLADIEAGTLKADKCLVVYRQSKPDGGCSGGVYVSNMTRHEQIAYLENAKQEALEDWLV